MILKVGSDAFVDHFAFHTRCLQHVWIPNAGELQNLRRLQSTAGNNDLFGSFDVMSTSFVGEVDTYRSTSVQFDIRHECVAQEMQIRPLRIGFEVTTSGVGSFPFVGSGACYCTQGVEKAKVIATPWIGWLFVISEGKGLFSLDRWMLKEPSRTHPVTSSQALITSSSIGSFQ